MGSIIGGIGALAGAQTVADQAGQSAAEANQGYNYLLNNPATNTFINNGMNASNNQVGVQGEVAGLLGVGPNSAADQQAFKNYQNSTGYQFQLGQGQQAVNTNAAASGLLDSGANAKALTQYGQNLASTTFNNYLSQLGGLNAEYGTTAQQGQNMLTNVGQIGTQAGIAAGQFGMQGAQAQANAYAGLGGAIGNSLGSLFGGMGGMGGMGI